MIRRSIGRAVARRAAQRESSSASSRVSCECLPLFHAGMELSPCPFGLLGSSFRPGLCCCSGVGGGVRRLGMGKKSDCGRESWFQPCGLLDQERLLHSLGKGFNLWQLPALKKKNQ